MIVDDIPLETMAQEEQRSHLASAAYSIAEMWSNGMSDVLSPRERVHGAVHSVLHLIENGTDGVPAFNLAPIFSEENDALTEVIRGDGPVQADWDYGVVMNLAGNENQPSTTQLYESIYDNHRGRFTIAARDLFEK